MTKETLEQISEKVQKIVAESFDVDQLTISKETTANDVDGWDSLAHATLLMRLERIFNIDLDRDQANAAQSLGALIGLIYTTLKFGNV
jgi:acyl carrier protein